MFQTVSVCYIRIQFLIFNRSLLNRQSFVQAGRSVAVKSAGGTPTDATITVAALEFRCVGHEWHLGFHPIV